jgi:nucleoside 2-deoxyribosyltransferase
VDGASATAVEVGFFVARAYTVFGCKTSIHHATTATTVPSASPLERKQQKARCLLFDSKEYIDSEP